MLYAKQEQQVSLVFWKDWLYKRLLYRDDTSLAFGMAELGCGGSTQRLQKAEHSAFYVLSGQGTIEQGGTRQPFKTGTQFTISPEVEYHFDCDSPTRLLVANGPTAFSVAFMLDEIKPTQIVPGSGHCQFVLNGKIKISLQDTHQSLPEGTAFYVEPIIGYTLQNVGNSNALILNVSGKAAPVGHEQHQVRR